MSLTTIGNDRFGIETGHNVRVTFVYLSVPQQWKDDAQVALRRIYENPTWTWEDDFKCEGKKFTDYYNQLDDFPSAPSLTSTFLPMCPLYAAMFYQLAGDVVLQNA